MSMLNHLAWKKKIPQLKCAQEQEGETDQNIEGTKARKCYLRKYRVGYSEQA